MLIHNIESMSTTRKVKGSIFVCNPIHLCMPFENTPEGISFKFNSYDRCLENN